MSNFEKMNKPSRQYDELKTERLNKDRKLSVRRQNGQQNKQYQQVDVNAIQDY